MILVAMRSKNLTIVEQVVEFWIEFKEDLVMSIQESGGNQAQILQQIDQNMQLCQLFIGACEILVEQCQLSLR